MPRCKNCGKVVPYGATFCKITCKIEYKKKMVVYKKRTRPQLQEEIKKKNIRGEKW